MAAGQGHRTRLTSSTNSHIVFANMALTQVYEAGRSQNLPGRLWIASWSTLHFNDFHCLILVQFRNTLKAELAHLNLPTDTSLEKSNHDIRVWNWFQAPCHCFQRCWTDLPRPISHSMVLMTVALDGGSTSHVSHVWGQCSSCYPCLTHPWRREIHHYVLSI